MIHRRDKVSNYTVIPNEYLHDSTLPDRAKLLLTQMLTLPDSWNFSIAGLISVFGGSSDKITAAVRDLEIAGYVERRQTHNGKFGHSTYEIYDWPKFKNEQSTENQSTEKQFTEKPAQVNTKQTITNIQNRTTPSPSRRQLIKPNEQFQKEQKAQAKITKFMDGKYGIIKRFDFSDKIVNRLMDFSAMLAEGGTFLTDISVEAQLTKLKTLTEAQQFQVIDQTITRGWKSLDYAVDNVKKGNRSSFDTARNSQNQFKTNEEKRKPLVGETF